MTFLEIMVVITILGIVIAISTPSLRNTYYKMQLHAAARQLGSLCRYARAAAVMREGEVRVLFDVENARYRLKLPPEDQDEEDRSVGRYRRMELERRSTVEQARFLPPDVEFQDILTDAPDEENPGRWTTGLIFYPNGSATPCFMVLRNRRGRMLTIEVQHSTGAVRIFRGEPEFQEPEQADADSR
ncbi:MAG: hypothetical protein Kow0059_09640 [Candidatus Sumerlaeia bacterium]